MQVATAQLQSQPVLDPVVASLSLQLRSHFLGLIEGGKCISVVAVFDLELPEPAVALSLQHWGSRGHPLCRFVEGGTSVAVATEAPQQGSEFEPEPYRIQHHHRCSSANSSSALR